MRIGLFGRRLLRIRVGGENENVEESAFTEWPSGDRYICM
jgi:hypothetical protein